MKSAILKLLFFVSLLAYSQPQWRPLGADDFKKPSYGNTFYSSNSGGGNRGGFKLCAKNGIVYSMNIEMNRNVSSNSPDWYVLGKYVNGEWEHIETPFWSNQHYLSTLYSFAVDNNGTPYILLNDPLNDNKVTVKKFDGTNWVTVGSDAVSSTYSYTVMEMAIGNDNLPFIIYKEENTVQAKKFNGTDWTTIPNAALQGLESAVIKMDANGIPYVLYSYKVGGYDDYSILKKFNGTAWEEIGITDFAGLATGLCFNSINQPYITIGRTLRKFNGTSWESIAGPNQSAPYLGYEKLTIDADDNLYLIYKTTTYDYNITKLVNGSWQHLAYYFCPAISIAVEGNTLYEEHIVPTSFAVVQKRVGSSWENLGNQSNIPSGIYGMSMNNGIPIIAHATLSQLSVKEFVSGAWSSVGSSIISEQGVSTAKIEISDNGTTYVAYGNIVTPSTSETKITVKKRVGNSWELVGPLNFSLSAGNYLGFKVNHQDVPYVVYKTGRVQKFNGTSWEFVGGSIYTGDKEVQIAFDNNDVPYVFYSDFGPKIVRYNGTAWEEVGTSSLTDFSNISKPQILCDSNNNIVIGFVGTGNSINILKWNGTIWEPISSQPITTDGFLKLTLDQNNAPVIVYNKIYNNFRNFVNVSRFNGTDWEPIGTTNFSATEVSDGTVVFTENNIPVVVYNSEAIYCKYYGEVDYALSVGNQHPITRKQLIISPNPASSIFSLNLDEEIQMIDIFDITGKKVLSEGNGQDIDISPLQSGLYFVQAKTASGNYTAKLLKK